MLSGSCILFTAGLSVVVLRAKLNMLHYVGALKSTAPHTATDSAEEGLLCLLALNLLFTIGVPAPGITLACVGVTVVSLVTLLAREEVASTDTRSTAIGIGLTLIGMVSP